MKFTKIPADAFRRMVLNAAVIASAFNPASGTLRNEDILGATTGGISFTAVPVYADMGEKVDNCPKNMKELKKLVSWEAKASGTFVTADTALAKQLTGSADVSGNTVTPRADLKDEDFREIWIVGDYSEYNGEQNGGWAAIRLKNALSTGGFSIETADGDRAKLAFEFTAHGSVAAQREIPFEIWLTPGPAEPAAGT
jgi:hypothetical protein